MEPIAPQEISGAAIDWELIVGILAAVSGWITFFFQRWQFKREKTKDSESWLAEFIKYRRQQLKPLTETLRKAYRIFAQNQVNAPAEFEEAMDRARFPNGLPIKPLSRWNGEHRATLDSQDEFLMRLAEHIYPPFNSTDKRSVLERSPLSQEDYETFDNARGGVADYFDQCGLIRQQSSDFTRFLENRVREGHYRYVKLLAYFELAYVRAQGDAQLRVPGKKHLFEFGNAWKSDDPRT